MRLQSKFAARFGADPHLSKIPMKRASSTTEFRYSPVWRWLARFVTTLIGIQIATLSAQTALSWQQVKDKFEAANPTLKAAKTAIDESKAEEITAYLRPNPNFTLSTDGTQLTPYEGIYRPFSGTQFGAAFSYLHERAHKRELRLESAKKATDVAVSAYSDQERNLQLDRANLLFDGGAIPKSAVEVAQNAEDDALIVLETTKEHLHVLGSDPDHPTGIVDVFAPVSGIITDQEITDGAGVQSLTPPNPFTISDISHVWIVCDVYENDMANVRLGEYADVHLDAYPNRVLKGRIDNILPILDPNIRTAKVRLEVENPGLMRLGMFVHATFHGLTNEKHATVPATAVLHLHDREWVYTPLGNGRFRRLEVVAGDMLPGNLQEIISGLNPDAQVVRNALVFQDTVEQ